MTTAEKAIVKVVEVTREGFEPEQMNRIFSAIGRMMHKLDYSFPAEPNLKYLNKITDSPDYGLHVAMDEGTQETIGTLTIGKIYEPAIARGQIGAVFVEEEYRRHGTGDMLMDAAKAWALREGVDVSLLQTEDFRGLERFYGRHGTLLEDTRTYEIPSGLGAVGHAQ